MPSLHLRQCYASQAGQHLQCASKVVLGGKAVARDDGGQASSAGGLQAVGRVFKGNAGAGWQFELCKCLQVNLRVRLFLRRAAGIFHPG